MTTATSPDLNSISTWTQADYALLTAAFINSMSNTQIQTVLHPEWIPSAVVAGLDNAHFAAFTASQFGQLNLTGVSASIMATWTAQMWAGLTASQVSSFSIAQIGSFQSASWLPVSAASGLLPAQMLPLSSYYSQFSAAWLNQLRLDSFQALDTYRLNEISAATWAQIDNNHLAALTAAQVGGMKNLTNLSSAQFGLLNISAISPQAIPDWTQTQYAGLTAQQISTLSTGQVKAILHPEWIPVGATSGFTPAQTLAFSANFTGVSAAWLNNLSILAFQAIPAAQMSQVSQLILSGLDSAHQSAFTEKAPYNALTAQTISTMTVAQISAMVHPEWLPLAAVSGLTNVQIPAFTASFSILTSDWLNSLSLPAFQSLTATQLNQISPATLAGLDTSHLPALTAAQVGSITDLSGLNSAQFSLLNISGMSATTIGKWTSTQYAGLTAQQISSLSVDQIKAIANPAGLPTVAIGGLRFEQMAGFHASDYSAGWINALTLDALKGLPPSQFYYCKRPAVTAIDDAHLAALTAAQVAYTNKLDALTSHQFGLLDISGFSTSALNGLTSIHFEGLTAKQISSLSTAQIQNFSRMNQLPFAAVSGLLPTQISAISMNFSQFSPDWLDSLTLPTFQSMTATQVGQISTATIAALDPGHQSALAALMAALAAASGPTLPSGPTSLASVSITTISGWTQSDYATLTALQVASLSPIQVLAMKHPEWIPAPAVAGISPAQIPDISISFANLPTAWLNNLSAAAIQALSTTQLNQISAATMSGLNNSQLAALSATQVASASNLGNLGSSQFGSLNISALSPAVIAGWSKINYAGLTALQMSTLSQEQLQSLSHGDWLPAAAGAGLTATQIPALASQMHALSAGFLNNLNLAAFQVLTGSQLAGLSAPAIDGLDANHLAVFSGNLQPLNTDELLTVAHNLTPQQINTLSLSQQLLLSGSATAAGTLINNLSDSGLKGIMQTLLAGNNSLFSFSAVSTVLKNFGAGLTNALTASQCSDLSSYVQNIGNVCGTNSALYSLASGMVNGENGASVDWTGTGTETRIGHLIAGSTPTQYGQLVSAWFDGANEPPQSSDTRVSGKALFANGAPTINDIAQGTLGDCAFLAALQTVVSTNPDFIRSMIIENPNNTYSVRFFNNNVAEWVTVDNTSYSLGNSGAGKWASILEHAFVNFTSTYRNSSNVYSSLIGGAEKLQQITGDAISGFSASSYSEDEWNTTVFDKLKSAVQSGESAEIASFQYSSDAVNGKESFVSGHMFSIHGFDSANSKFIVSNPWGAMYTGNFNGTFEASMDDIWQGQARTVYIANSSGASGVVGQLVTAMAVTAIPPAASSSQTSSPINASSPIIVVSHT